MKKLLLILAVVFVLALIGCSAEEATEPTQTQTCYNILARGYDDRGDYIIVKISNFVQKRYSVGNYLEYINQDKVCEPINLTEQEL